MLSNLELPAGRYVLAVSGGVDSVVLLDLLADRSDLQLVVAHFDHGIRPDSAADRKFVQSLAAAHRLPFVYDRTNLGEGASEAIARQARYKFLFKVCRATGARALITAHHGDDMLETAIINLIRGTGRRGLSALKSNQKVLRPLLSQSKADLLQYAKQQNLRWHEDSTNQDDRYLRNQVRHQVLSKFSQQQRQQFAEHVEEARKLNHQIDNTLVNLLHLQPHGRQLNRAWFINLPHIVSREIMASWLRENKIVFDRRSLERLVVAAKTYDVNKVANISGGNNMVVGKTSLALQNNDR